MTKSVKLIKKMEDVFNAYPIQYCIGDMDIENKSIDVSFLMFSYEWENFLLEIAPLFRVQFKENRTLTFFY